MVVRRKIDALLGGMVSIGWSWSCLYTLKSSSFPLSLSPREFTIPFCRYVVIVVGQGHPSIQDRHLNLNSRGLRRG